MQDSKGNIWFSTDRGGICRYNEVQDNFTSFGINEGLPDDVCYDILEDEHSNLWFGTNKGLVRFNPESGDVSVFTNKDGLLGTSSIIIRRLKHAMVSFISEGGRTDCFRSQYSG